MPSIHHTSIHLLLLLQYETVNACIFVIKQKQDLLSARHKGVYSPEKYSEGEHILASVEFLKTHYTVYGFGCCICQFSRRSQTYCKRFYVKKLDTKEPI